MSLVGIAEIERQRGPVAGRARVDARHRFVQTVALDQPLGAGADVITKQSLQGTRSQAEFRRHLLDPRDVAIAGNAFGDARDEVDHGIVAQTEAAQERFVDRDGGILFAPALPIGSPQSNISHPDDNRTVTDKGTLMKQHAKGAFDVKLQPLEAYNKNADAGLGRMSIDKRFHGDLDATSQGEMLHAGSAKGSGGYVAIERVTGTLGGRRGSFALQHNATMTDGTPCLNIIVVPGSGTEELAGLDGTMKIVIEAGGKHFYEFDYELAK